MMRGGGGGAMAKYSFKRDEILLKRGCEESGDRTGKVTEEELEKSRGTCDVPGRGCRGRAGTMKRVGKGETGFWPGA